MAMLNLHNKAGPRQCKRSWKLTELDPAIMLFDPIEVLISKDLRSRNDAWAQVLGSCPQYRGKARICGRNQSHLSQCAMHASAHSMENGLIDPI